MAAQIVVITESSPNYADLAKLRKVKWAWTSATGGAIADQTADGQVNKTTYKYTGEVVRLITNPGSTAPTDNYDVTILDDDGYDVLMGAGADRDTANTEQVLASSLGVCIDSQLRLNIANAGDAKVGEVILYIKQP